MRGLELCRRYYEEYGAPMLHDRFPEFESVIAVGLVGSGSECFGFDDEISTDHDFEPGFCLFIPDETVMDSRAEFRLEREYAKLPNVFLGFERQRLSPVGGNRHGVIRADAFYTSKTGGPRGCVTLTDWLSVPDSFLAEATNGEIFRDDAGQFSAVRQSLLHRPEDVRRKKLAGNLLLMAQSGQYNYARCLAHGERGAARLAAGEFVNSAIAAVFLLNGRYMPFYKWRFRAMRELPILSGLETPLTELLTGENDPEAGIEEVSAAVTAELKSQSLTRADSGDLERHAYSVNDSICDAWLRNEHILSCV